MSGLLGGHMIPNTIRSKYEYLPQLQVNCNAECSMLAALAA